MKIRLFFALASLLLLAACGQRVDHPIAMGDGFGREWSGAPGQVRISVNNRLTREIVAHVDAPKAHYEITVGPGHQRHMIVPDAENNFKFSLYYSDGKEVGGNYMETDDRNGAKGRLIDIGNP